MSRFFRRMPRFRKRQAAERSHGLMTPQRESKHAAGTPQAVSDVRAKSARNKQVTADKWNQ
jgi:hypothetical protein